MRNPHVPVATAVVGACVQLTYVHARYAVSAAPGVNSPIQSLGVGDVIPAHWADTVAPAMTVAGLAVRVLGTLGPKVAVTEVAADMVTVPEPVPAQPPPLPPLKVEPEAGGAVSGTAVP